MVETGSGRRFNRRAKAAVVAGFLSMFTVFGVAYSFGAFFKPMGKELGSGRSATSAVFSITAFAYFLLGVVSGRVVDRVGPRKVLLTGAVVMAAGLALTSRVHSIWLGYATYGVGVGVGVACGYVPMLAVIGGWFERGRAMALGIAVAGIGLGTLVVPPLGAALVDAYGWRTTYVVFAAASAAILVVSAALATPAPVSNVIEVPRVGEALRTTAFRSLYGSGFLMSLAMFQVFVYIAPFAEDHGVEKVAAATLVGIVGGTSIVGRLGLGFLAERVGRVRMYRSCFFVMAASFAIWLVAGSFPVLVVFAVVFGVGYGGFIALSPAVVADLFGPIGMGGLIGVLYTSAAFGGLVGPPLAGLLIDHAGYRPAIAASLALAALGWVALLPLGRVGPAARPAALQPSSS